LKALQQAGVLVPFEGEDGLALIGRGMTASGHPMLLIDFANALAHTLEELDVGILPQVSGPADWLPCLTEDLKWLGLYSAAQHRVELLAPLWPFAPQAP
jgi:hypothetical protein